MEETQGSTYLQEQAAAAKSERDQIAQRILEIEKEMDEVQQKPTYDFDEEEIAQPFKITGLFDHFLIAFALFPIFLGLLLLIAHALGIFSRDIWLKPFLLYIAPAIYFVVLFGFLNRPKQKTDYDISQNPTYTPPTQETNWNSLIDRAEQTNPQEDAKISQLKASQEDANKRYQNFSTGRDAEEELATLLGESLNDDWSLFRNVPLDIVDGSKEDVDAILVGPNGVFALEVKARNGAFRYTGKLWEYQNRSGEWKRFDGNVPSQQAKRNAKRLNTYLKECNLDVFVNPRLAWANPNLKLVVPPEVPVWFMDDAEAMSADLYAHPELPSETVEHIKNAIGIRLE